MHINLRCFVSTPNLYRFVVDGHLPEIVGAPTITIILPHLALLCHINIARHIAEHLTRGNHDYFALGTTQGHVEPAHIKQEALVTLNIIA